MQKQLQLVAARGSGFPSRLLFCAVGATLLGVANAQSPDQQTAQTVMVAIILGLAACLLLCLLLAAVAALLSRRKSRRCRQPVCEQYMPQCVSACPMPMGQMTGLCGPMMC